MKRVLQHAVLVGLALGFTVSVQHAFRGRYVAERKSLASESRARRVNEVATVWNALHYTDIQDGQPVWKSVTNAPFQSLLLSSPQGQKLELRLAEVFKYLHNPSFEEYYRLKTENLVCQYAPSDRAKGLLTNTLVNLQDPREVAQRLWDSVGEKDRAARRSGMTAICLDQIAAALSSTNSLSVILRSKASKGMTVLRQTIDPGFSYGFAAPSNSVPREPLFVHLSFFARSSSSTNAGPVYLSLGWSDRSQNWVLSGMYSDVLLNMGCLF